MSRFSSAGFLSLMSLTLVPGSLLPGAALVYGAATPSSQLDQNNAVATGARSETPVEVDVVVVGGGYSGVMSAYDLQQAGLSTVLLEASDILGGRSRSVQRQSGPGVIELGATWINEKTQPIVWELTQQFGLETAEQYTDGESVFQGLSGEVERLPEDFPLSTTDPVEQELEQLFLGLVLAAENETDIYRWDNFPVEQDLTFADWVALNGAEWDLWNSTWVQGLASRLTSSIVGREPHEVGAQYFLDYVTSGWGLLSLSTEGELGAQSLKYKKGSTALVTSMADTMTPGSVIVGAPVTSITQSNETALVTVKAKTGQTFLAKKVILAIPTNTYSEIEFSPPLPCKKNTIISQTKPGIYAKMIISYAEPWWRNAGLVGKFTSLIGPVCFSWDTSDLSQEQYSLAIFVAGDIATRWHALPEDEKEGAVVDHLAELVGEDLAEAAQDVLEINYVEWTFEDHLWGAPTSSMGPGLLRKYGASMREPFGGLHFGGGEMAYEWKGYLEGAITAGKTAAKEVITALGAEV